MKNNNKDDYSDWFDDDFEVTYEDDYGSAGDIYDSAGDTREFRSSDRDALSSDETVYMDSEKYNRYLAGYDDDDDYDDHNYDDNDYDDYDSRYSDGRRKGGRNSSGRSSDRDDYDTDNRRRSSRRRRGNGVPLAAPIRKGGRVLSRLAQAVVRSLTAVLIIATAAYVTWTFWRASTPYGDIMEMIETKQPTMTMTAYVSCVLIFLLFEFISLIWSMTRVRVRDGYNSWKEDAGRGLTSFVIVFAVSYLAFFVSPLIPDSPEIIYGLKGALDVYGSMHNVLLGLCAAGIISCLVRKYL